MMTIVLVLTGLLAVLAGCASTEPQSAVDAKAVLEAAVAPMKALQSFHFTYDVVKPKNAKPIDGTEIVRIVGDVTMDGRMNATIDLLQRSVPLQLAFIADGATHYLQDPTSQKWQSIAAEYSPVGKVNLNAGAIQILEQITQPTYDGVEKVDGVECYRIMGSVTASAVASIAGVVTTSQNFATTLWVGTEDSLVRRIELVGAASPDEDVKTVRVIVPSKFDEPVTISPPK